MAVGRYVITVHKVYYTAFTCSIKRSGRVYPVSLKHDGAVMGQTGQ